MSKPQEENGKTTPKAVDPGEALRDAVLSHIKNWPAPGKLTHADKERFVHKLMQGDGLRDLQKRPIEEVAATLEYLWKNIQIRRFKDIFIDVQEDKFGYDDRVDITIIQRRTPFMTDSVLNMLRQNHLYVGVTLNENIKIRRDDDGNLLSTHDDDELSPDILSDKVLHIQCEYRGEKLDIDALKQSIHDVLRDVQAAVEDWIPMQGQIAETINDLEDSPDMVNGEDAYEAAQFLTFLKEGNFTFLGYREHTLRRDRKITYFDMEARKSLGILRDKMFLLFDGLITDDLIPERVRNILTSPDPLMMVVKANRVATVHRSVYMDVVVIKKFNAKGEIEALRLFAGLFTSQCYAKPTDQIPLLKRKAQTVLMRSGYESDSHRWRALKHVIESYPRDELFQIDTELLNRHATGIVRLSNRPEVEVFVREDTLQRYFSVLVYLPKDQYDTTLRLKTQDILERALKGRAIDHYMQVDEKPLARLQYTIACDTPLLPDYDRDRLRESLALACMPWFDRLKAEVVRKYGKETAIQFLADLGSAFSVVYQDQAKLCHAIDDLPSIQKTMREKDLVVTMHRYDEDPEGHYRIKIFKRDDEARLSELLPMLDRMGFDCLHEYSYVFTPSDSGLPRVWMHELVGTFDYLVTDELEKIQPLFAEAFDVIWRGRVDSDSFNTLVLAAGLNWREANLFRALARYLDLAEYPLGKRYMGQVLAKYPHVTRCLKDIFLTRHDPALDIEKADLQTKGLLVEIEHLMDKVEKLDEDRVLRSMTNILCETLRTNYFHADADVLVLKLNSEGLADLPQPRPYREIFIYSHRMEAVHLRGGPIARGGLRWSDRYEDFRTEILGLVKAQIVKNAVIVPVGAKGGFICKNLEQMKTPEERRREGITCYETMIRSLLSVTDNLVDGLVVPPADTRRHDGDDPYLVVAADKGTASFSNIANKISLEHNFWLGDAFASGGSQGYDHKEMGITARGAWECVKRHFRELGKDIQSEDFTVAGVGDMSGDVFGNGMLLSEHIRLVAAFDHRHIFIDPNPDAKKSHAERKRLFEMPASSWADYNPKLLSKGGAVFSRQDKSVTLTPEIKALLDIAKDRVTPFELMQAVLRAPVELLYFGGIGTYIKAEDETHDQVGDKANDPVRVDATALRCKVIGEGANLGVTQLGRVEFARKGGCLNTDFIDNVGGVDTSDHEVNIKILLQPPLNDGKLPLEQRNKLLHDMTNDVATHVLSNNYDQSLALSLVARRAAEDFNQHTHFIRHLEKQGFLNRKLEFLPDEEEIHRLSELHQGFTRPELAVVLAYSKITLYKDLLATDLPDDPALYQPLEAYFPDILRKKFAKEIPAHKLSREIVATELTNAIVNRMGPTFVTDMALRVGADIGHVVRAWVLTQNVFDLQTLWREVDALDNVIPADQQLVLYQKIVDCLDQGTAWFLQQYGHNLPLEDLQKQYSRDLFALQNSLYDVLPESLKDMVQQRRKKLQQDAPLPDGLMRRIAHLPILLAGCDVIALADKTKRRALDVSQVYFTLAERLNIPQMRQMMDNLPVETSWAQEAIETLEDNLRTMLATLTMQALQQKDNPLAWLKTREQALHAYDQALADLMRAGAVDLSLVMVASQRLGRLIEAGGHEA